MPLYGNWPCGNNLWRVHSLMSHASIQNGYFMDRFSEMTWPDHGKVRRITSLWKPKEIGPDSWAMTNARQYAYAPMVAVQADMSSDAGVGKFKNIYERIIKFHADHPRLIEFVFMKFALVLFFILIFISLIFALFLVNKLLVSSGDDRLVLSDRNEMRYKINK